MRVERIVVTGDVFRTTHGEPNQLYNTRWLHGEISHRLHELTGLSPEIGFRCGAPDDDRTVIGAWYGLLGRTPSLQAWAATFNETAPPAALIEAMRPDYDRAIVIGFELSPLVRSVLHRIGAPWVDVGLNPLRFLDDLALDWRFSWPVEIAHSGLLSPGHVWEAVGRVRARYGSGPLAAGLEGACMFLGQTRHDRTLIKNGGFYPDGEAVERVAAALKGRPLVIKPHPLAPDNPLLYTLSRHFGASTTDANVYQLLATANDVRFLTISSSAAIEARHFGHDTETFHDAAHTEPASVTSLWAHRCAGFWRAALTPVLPVTAEIDFEERPVADRLRRSLGSWGWPPPERITTPPASSAAAARSVP